MSEVVVSAVVGEAVSRVSTFFIDKHKRKLSEEDGMERLEMAHIRMEAALEISGKWPPVTDASLLRWRKKLKLASDECSQVMDRCKRRAMEDDEMEQEIRRCSFPRRIAHATRSFISSFTGQKKVDSLVTTSTIQKFERFANGAGEFLRFMEFGSIGRINNMLVDPLTGHLLAGKALQYENSHGNQYYLAARPMRFAERGQEAGVLLRHQNHERPEENFILGIILRLAASTNVTGIVARCLELLPPNFKPVAEAAKQELTQLHQRVFYCFPFVDSIDPEYWSIHHAETHRARPNSACCEEHEQHGRSRSSDMLATSGALPEPVIKLAVQRYVSTRQKLSSSSSSSGFSGDSGPPLLQLTAVFAPHLSPEQLPSRAESVTVVAIDGREEQPMRTNVGLHELEELLLPNAVDRLWHEVADGSSAHEVFWSSGHGVAYLCVEKIGTEMTGCRPTHWPCSALVRQRRRRGGWWLVAAAQREDRKRGERPPNHQPMRESYMISQPRNWPALSTFVSRSRLTVAQALSNHRWVRDLRGSLSNEAMAQYFQLWYEIRRVHLNSDDDCIRWKPAADGHFSCSSAYNLFFMAMELCPIWKERNARVFDQQSRRPDQLVEVIKEEILVWKEAEEAEECDNKICKCRQHVEEEEAEQLVRNSFFPRQIVHATKSPVLSIHDGNIYEPNRSVVRRFEWYADGANDFLRSVEFGGAPCHYLFFDPLVGHVLAGVQISAGKQRAAVISKNILMSEVIASAVVGEAVSRISTFLIDKHKRKSSEEDGLERLEMAQIKMEAALEVSSRWPLVMDSSLLRWRKKLKRASNECSHVMDRCKRRAMEDDETEKISQCSFPKRIALATKSFLSSFATDKNVDSLNSISTIQRFERFADGAGEFLKFMEFGRIGSINYMLVDPLTGHLLAGKALQYGGSHGNQYYLAARPMSFAERGQEAGVLLRYNNHERPEENFVLGTLLRLTASTNVTGIVARCLELLPPNFKPVAEAAKQELTQVHQRAFYCFPFVDSTDPEYRSIHHSETSRARPNPACCEGHEHHGQSRSSDMVEPSGTFPEPVIKLFVQRHVPARPPSGHGDGEKRFSEDSGPPLLQVTAIFAPHASPEDLPSGAKSVAVVAIDGREEQAVRTNIRLREVEEFLLPGAVDRLCHDHDLVDGSSAHEVFLRSRHGVAYLCVEKMGTEMAKCRLTQWRV
uniref:Uncharacterized protein n=1 Tax=Oryza punctata TaxID=4537 RepID=A0A0E0LGI2_ORYPU